MLKLGSGILSIWLILNFIPSSVIVVDTLFRGGHTPALYAVLTEEEVSSLSAEVLTTIDSIAVFANGTNIAFSILALPAVWMGLNRRQAWAFWVLLAGFAAALIGGTAADYVVGWKFPWVNVLSGGILACGFGCAAVGLFRNERAS